MNYTDLKSELINCGWGYALDLLEALQRREPEKLEAWYCNPSTITLRDICQRFEKTNLYSHRTDPLPFFNDVCAIDAARLHINIEQAKAA